MLQVRDFNGFHPLTSVGPQYIIDNDSFSVYAGEYQICRISAGNGNDEVSIEIFSAKLYCANVEKINNIIALYV